jgi:hypothetical protein
MRNLGIAVQELINGQGVEPVNILEVQWVRDGPFIPYSDKELLIDNVPGVILELGNLESIIKLDSQGRSESISVKLDDTSGAIKDIINVNDVHGSTVRLYQWFETLPITERFQLYEGEIASPIIWSEGDRTVSFNVITKLNDKEVGFSPEEANLPFVPDELVGKAWPLVFGTVQNVPAVRLQEIPRTQIAQDLGVVDPTLRSRRQFLFNERIRINDNFLVPAAINLAGWASCCDFPGQNPEETEFCCQQEDVFQGLVDALAAQIGSITQEFDQLGTVLANQLKEQAEKLKLIDARNFPQGQQVIVRVGSIQLKGVIDNNELIIDERTLLNFDDDFTKPFGFTFVQGGATITIDQDQEITYVANILDSNIQSVQVFRELENGRVLVTIPRNWYTIEKIPSGPYTFTIIKFNKPLSSRDETLDDEIYITQTGSIGPNTVDIMKWLIATYTDLAFDFDTFFEVRTALENYPSHFALLDRKDIITVLEEIAFQARCSIWLNNNVFYIKYLSKEEESVDTLTETNIDAGSLIVETTTTEEVVTKLVALWTDNLVQEDKNKIVLRHNVKKYGTKEREIDFYIYNIQELVLKSATFWLIRYANVWKTLSFDCYVDKLFLETFDTITLSFSTNFVADRDVKALITDANYNTSDGLLTLTCWTPVRFGEMAPYDFSWPKEISVQLIYPTPIEIQKGYAGTDGPGKEVKEIVIRGVNPLGSIIFDDDRRQDYGDNVPSDLDDKFPDVNFPGVPFDAGEAPEFEYEYLPHELVLPEEEEDVQASVAFIAILTTDVSAAQFNNDEPEKIIMGSGSALTYTFDGEKLIPRKKKDSDEELGPVTVYNSTDSKISQSTGEQVARVVQVKSISKKLFIDVVPC